MFSVALIYVSRLLRLLVLCLYLYFISFLCVQMGDNKIYSTFIFIFFWVKKKWFEQNIEAEIIKSVKSRLMSCAISSMKTLRSGSPRCLWLKVMLCIGNSYGFCISPLFYGGHTVCIRTGHGVLKQQYRSTTIFQPEKHTGPFSAKEYSKNQMRSKFSYLKLSQGPYR